MVIPFVFHEGHIVCIQEVIYHFLMYDCLHRMLPYHILLPP